MRRAVFFDLYGTLIDIITDEYDPGVYSVLSRYLSYQLIKISPERLKASYFEDIQSRLKGSNEPYPEVDVCQIFSNIMERYGNRRCAENLVEQTARLFRSLTVRRFDLFPGVYNALASLDKKWELAIISDAQWVFAEPEMAMLGLDPFFRVRVLSSRLGFKKPDVRLFDIAMKELMASPGDSVYIGDNPQKDLVGAKKAGMKFILFRPENKSYDDFKPDCHFNDYSELIKVLEDA
ncbi:MAG: HAD family hydrolase [Thermodesulfobacteriota bacterium]